MSLRENFTEKRIQKQVAKATESLAAQLEESAPYFIRIGRTPGSMSAWEHMQTVAEGTLESLGDLGIQASLQYDQHQSTQASTRAYPALTGYMLGPDKKPTVVFTQD